MNIEKADYGTIIKFGTLDDLINKMKLENQTIGNIINLVDNNGVSLLEKSLISRKFDISRYLLDNGASVNVISKDGYNEFHFLSPNINYQGAISIGRILVNRGTSVMQKDLKYGNTAFFSLCKDAFKERLEDVVNFIEECFDLVTDIDDKNNNGYSIRDLICERGTDELRRRMDKK